MPPRNRLLIAGAAALALAAAAIGQEQRPESLLPPGFSNAPPPPPAPAAPAAPGTPAAPAAPDATAADGASLDSLVDNETTDQGPPPPPEMPAAARRSLDHVGATDIYGDQAFGGLDGRWLATLMRGIQAPIASRWGEIVLRRALLARTPAPAGEGQADWVADRAALLLRLGESNGARMLVQAVDVDMFSPRLRRVAIESALASADPAGLCPLPDGNETVGTQAIWPMVRAMCAALSNDAATANATIGRGNNGEIDHLLAEKIAGAGGARHAQPIDWTGVDSLTDWRFGLATALNILVPQPLLDSSPSWFKAWAAQAPMIAASDRVPYARFAAAQGVVSAAELVDLYGRVMDEAGQIDTDSPSGRLRAAYLGDDDDARLSAMHSLWDGAQGGEPDRYAASILTARAAARIAPDTDRKGDAVAILGSLFSAGLDIQAARWAPIVAQMKGEDGDRAWALLSVGAPRAPFQINADRLQSYAKRAGDDGKQRTAMLAAALAGLGRITVADADKVASAAGLPLGQSAALAKAMGRTGGARGAVALLAAVGMQSPGWTGVPPGDFYQIIAGLRAAGMEPEARMIAAEAMTRL